MPDKSRSLHYAEDVLGVHRVFEQANQARKNLDDLYTRLDKFNDQKRDLAAKVADREIEIITEERGANPEMSQAQMDRHLKVVNHNDATLSKLRRDMIDLSGIIDGSEYDAKMCNREIDIAVARMNELGGYMHYLAAVKTQSG